MRILFVGIASSIHAARWVRQLDGLGWDIHFFNGAPQWGTQLHRLFPKTTYHGPKSASLPRRAFRKFVNLPQIKQHYDRFFGQAKHLARLVDRLRPDVIHSLAIQQGGYPVLDAMQYLSTELPPWIVTNYGSDIYFFGQMPEHAERVKAVLRQCDYYSCETQRDLDLAHRVGLSGIPLAPIMPNAGGYHLDRVVSLRQLPTSKRRVIAIKGYQHLYGRAFVALRAIERCADVLQSYEICIYSSSSEDVEQIATMIAARTGLKIRIIPQTEQHDTILRLHGSARVSISLSISDGACTSFLEALLMGAYPIQSCTAAAHEWIEDGVTGSIVHPDDPDSVEAAIRFAVANDEVVDQAALLNWKCAQERLDYEKNRVHAIRWYEHVARREVYVPTSMPFS